MKNFVRSLVGAGQRSDAIVIIICLVGYAALSAIAHRFFHSARSADCQSAVSQVANLQTSATNKSTVPFKEIYTRGWLNGFALRDAIGAYAITNLTDAVTLAEQQYSNYIFECWQNQNK